MNRGAFAAAVATCNFSLGACMSTPELGEATGGVPVYDIVLRTKCELSDALSSDGGTPLAYTRPKFYWLQKWVAQVDFSLQVLDQATFSPGASLMQPLHNAYPA